MDIFDNDLFSIQEARILAEKAKESQLQLTTYSQKMLDNIVEVMANKILDNLQELSIESVNETDYGNYEDKYIKDKFVCTYVLNMIKDMKCVGIINNDPKKQIMDIGIPVGVIVALCPVTSPVSTVIYKTLISIKSGNSIIFSPHPRAKKIISKTLDLLIKAGKEAGLPENAVSYMRTITKQGTTELINHRLVSMVINTGITSLLKECNKSGKPLIFGGIGSGPAFVEKTADLKKAAQDIINSKTFDNGIVSAAEQSVVVDKVIEEKFRKEFLKAGAYFMNNEESDKLAKIIYRENGSLNPMAVGKTALELSKKAGLNIDEGVKLLVSEQKYVSEHNPYSREKLCPVISYYVEEDWQNACEKCIELLLTERFGHTLTIHSNDPFVIEQFALKKPVGRMLVNTPATYGSMGMTTGLFPSMTLGSGSTGKGITSDNVSPKNLIYIRKVGYENISVNDVRKKILSNNESINSKVKSKKCENNGEIEIIDKIVSIVLEEFNKNKN